MITRAMNLALPEQEVLNGCKKKAIRISSMEPLMSGGTHLVCITIEDADEARRVFGKSLIDGPVRRFAFQRNDQSRYS